MKRILGLLAALFFLAAPVFALAAPIPYYNQPFDTPNAAVNSLIQYLNGPNGPAFSQSVVTCTGTTTATCQGTRLLISITGLTTAAGVTSATVTVTDVSVAANSIIICQVNGYGGTGNPAAVNVVPGAGSFTFAIQNTHATAALNATVPVACNVSN